MASEPTTEGHSREEMKKAAVTIATHLRWFVENYEQHLSGLEIEYLIQAAQFLENLNAR